MGDTDESFEQHMNRYNQMPSLMSPSPAPTPTKGQSTHKEIASGRLCQHIPKREIKKAEVRVVKDPQKFNTVDVRSFLTPIPSNKIQLKLL